MRKRLLTVVFCVLVVSCFLPSLAFAKTTTRLSISISSHYEHYDSKPLVSGVLKTSSGRLLKYKTVMLYCGTTRMATGHTDSKGKVRLRATLRSSTSGAWRLKYAGSSTYRPATSASTSTRIHFHYYGPADFVMTDTGDLGQTLWYFQVVVPYQAGHTYCMGFSTPATVVHGQTGSSTPSDVRSAYGTSFIFTAHSSTTYRTLLTTDANQGGSGSENVLIW